MVGAMPMVIIMLVCVNVLCQIEGVTLQRTGSEGVACVVISLVALARCGYDARARPILGFLTLLLPVAFGVAWFLRSFCGALLEAQGAKEAANRSLADSQDDFARVLNSLCNVVMHVDTDLRLQDPTWQLHDLLMAGPGNPAELQGRSLLEFMASDAESAKLQSFMSGERQQGPASVFSVEMQDLQGARFTVQLHHTLLNGDGRKPLHLLGACLARDPASQREPPPLSNAQIGTPLPRRGEVPEAAPLADWQHLVAGLQKAASVASDSQVEAASLDDPSCIAVRFDAGSLAFDLTRSTVFTGRAKKKIGLLHMLGQADGLALQRWVKDQVYEYDCAMKRGHPFQPTLFAGKPSFKLLAMRSRQLLQPSRMWLQVHEETDDEEIPLTLWLQGIEILTRSQTLASLNEEGADAVSESSDDLAHESVSVTG